MIAVVVRSLERVFAVLAGILSIYLGYLLFLQIPYEVNSQGQVTLPGGTVIYLSRVGPGAFLALFGAIVVAISFRSSVKYLEETQTESKEVQKRLKETQTESEEVQKRLKETQTESEEVQKRLKEAQTELEKVNMELKKVSITAFGSSVRPANTQGLNLDQIEQQLRKRLNTERKALGLDILDKLSSFVGTNVSDDQVRRIHIALIKGVWGPDWGDFNDFQVWVTNGASDIIPETVNIDAINYYRGIRATP